MGNYKKRALAAGAVLGHVPGQHPGSRVVKLGGVKKGSIKLWKNDQSILIVILSEAKILLISVA